MLLLKYSDLTLSREQMKQLKGGFDDYESLNTCTAKCDVKDGHGGSFKSGCYSNQDVYV